MAKHVLELCNEASASLFEKPPHDQKLINSTLNNVKGLKNEDAYEAIKVMVTNWRLISGFATHKNHSNDEVNFVVQLRNQADYNREKLIDWANRIRY